MSLFQRWQMDGEMELPIREPAARSRSPPSHGNVVSAKWIFVAHPMMCQDIITELTDETVKCVAYQREVARNADGELPHVQGSVMTSDVMLFCQ